MATTELAKLKITECLAIDAGNLESGWVAFEEAPAVRGGMIINGFGKHPNSIIRKVMSGHKNLTKNLQLVLEAPRPSGMPVSAETMDMLVELGKFRCCWRGPWTYVSRQDVKMNLCGRAAATDSNIRRALVDRFGGDNVAIGGKKCDKCKGKCWTGRDRLPCTVCDTTGWKHPPGPCYKMAKDAWQALGLACFWVDHHLTYHKIMELTAKWRKKACVS